MNVVLVFFFFATIDPSGFVTTEEVDDDDVDDFLLFFGPSDLELAAVDDFTLCCSWRPAKASARGAYN